MKKLSEKEIQKRAAAVFKDHPKAEAVFVAEDGQAFLPESKGLAVNYSRGNGMKLHEVANPAIKQEKPVNPEELEAKAADLQKREAALEAREKALAEKEAKASKSESK